MTNIEEINKEKEDILFETRILKLEIDEMYNRFREIEEQEFELDDRFTKISCPHCKMTGIVKENEKRVVCPTCNGRKFIWAKKYED